MVSVIVAADHHEKKFWGAFLNILSRSFKTAHCVSGCLDVRCEDAELFVTDARGMDLICSKTAVFVFNDATELPVEIETDSTKLAVVDSCNKEAMRSVSKTKLPAITCGLSPCDSLTLSSIKEDSAVISIQRCITCFDGSIVEPQEIPVSLFAPVGSFALLCAGAIFILTGNVAKLTQVKI